MVLKSEKSQECPCEVVLKDKIAQMGAHFEELSNEIQYLIIVAKPCHVTGTGMSLSTSNMDDATIKNIVDDMIKSPNEYAPPGTTLM